MRTWKQKLCHICTVCGKVETQEMKYGSLQKSSFLDLYHSLILIKSRHTFTCSKCSWPSAEQAASCWGSLKDIPVLAGHRNQFAISKWIGWAPKYCCWWKCLDSQLVAGKTEQKNVLAFRRIVHIVANIIHTHAFSSLFRVWYWNFQRKCGNSPFLVKDFPLVLPDLFLRSCFGRTPPPPLLRLFRHFWSYSHFSL